MHSRKHSIFLVILDLGYVLVRIYLLSDGDVLFEAGHFATAIV